MKNFSNLLAICVVAMAVCGCTAKNQPIGMPNPWTDCKDSYSCASKIAGFNMPLKLSNYSVRAMKDMIEVTYPLDEHRYVTVRKGYDESNNGDNSGDYNHYPVNKVVTISNGVEINTRGDKDKIYVMFFMAESGVYSARCEQGISAKEVEDIYNVIREVEESHLP